MAKGKTLAVAIYHVCRCISAYSAQIHFPMGCGLLIGGEPPGKQLLLAMVKELNHQGHGKIIANG